MRSTEVFLVCCIFIDIIIDEIFGIPLKQITGESGQRIIQESGRNAFVAQNGFSGSDDLESSAAKVINLFNGIMQILHRNQTKPAPTNLRPQQSPVKFNWNLDQYVEPLNGAPSNDFSQRHQQQPLAHLDTGGTNFDRFIVSANENDNPLLDSIVGKFNRRGLDWSNGNLRLVNMHGNSVLGSDVVVHDRSVEIPLKQWLYAFNSLFKPSSNYA